MMYDLFTKEFIEKNNEFEALRQNWCYQRLTERGVDLKSLPNLILNSKGDGSYQLMRGDEVLIAWKEAILVNQTPDGNWHIDFTATEIAPETIKEIVYPDNRKPIAHMLLPGLRDDFEITTAGDVYRISTGEYMIPWTLQYKLPSDCQWFQLRDGESYDTSAKEPTVNLPFMDLPIKDRDGSFPLYRLSDLLLSVLEGAPIQPLARIDERSAVWNMAHFYPNIKKAYYKRLKAGEPDVHGAPY